MTNNIILGSAQFGQRYGVMNRDELLLIKNVKMLELAENSIKMIDTAMSYGEAESALGKINLQNFNVITKIPR